MKLDPVRRVAGLSVDEVEEPGRGQGRLSSGGGCTGLVRPPLLPLDDAAIGELAGLLDQATLAPIAPGLTGS
jgi:hypothetical protein